MSKFCTRFFSETVRDIDMKPKAGGGLVRGLYSLSGVPALSICCGFTNIDGKELPLALQIAGRPFDEATVLNTAYAYEQSNSWKDKRPEF